MKKIYFLVLTFLLLGVAGANAQVAIGTTNDPKAPLEVVGKATDATVADGVIAPRISLEYLKAKDNAYTTAQNGAIVYVDNTSGGTTTKTANITAVGYYFYDGAKWQSMAANPRMTLVGLQGGTFTEGTVVYVTDITGTPTGATENVTGKGYYYFDGAKWQAFGGESGSGSSKPMNVVSVKAATYTVGSTDDFVITEHSNAVTITFPDQTAAEHGRMVYVLNHNSAGMSNQFSDNVIGAGTTMLIDRGSLFIWDNDGSRWVTVSK